MKKYLLLRDNYESGPYSIEQLRSTGLLPLDLIWIENESTAWKYPGEIEDVKNLINHTIASQKTMSSRDQNEKVFISLPLNFIKKDPQEMNANASLPVLETEPVLETNYVKHLDELKENYNASKQKKPVWNKRIVPSAKATSVAAVFIGVVLGAFVIKNMVDGYVQDATEETATAIPILDRESDKEPNENIKNALATEIVPVYKKFQAKISNHVNIKKQLAVKTNSSKVGLFGGINGLQLNVFNTSPQVVDKVIVALDYFRPNGAVVQSENVSFSYIKPKGAQTISSPVSNRGVKLRYKILKVYAHDYKADLKQA
jgi:hypothetical protein